MHSSRVRITCCRPYSSRRVRTPPPRPCLGGGPRKYPPEGIWDQWLGPFWSPLTITKMTSSMNIGTGYFCSSLVLHLLNDVRPHISKKTNIYLSLECSDLFVTFVVSSLGMFIASALDLLSVSRTLLVSSPMLVLSPTTTCWDTRVVTWWRSPCL